MQSINSSNKSHPTKKLLLLSSAALLVVAGILYYTETRHITSFFIKNPSASQLTPQQKEEATKNDPTTSSPSSAKSDAQPAPGVNQNQTTSQVPVSTTSSVTITTLNQVNGAVNIKAAITNPATSGACTVTFTKSDAKPVTRTINTTDSTCTAAIPELEFSMIGDWQAEVRYFANNEQTTTTGTITIK